MKKTEITGAVERLDSENSHDALQVLLHGQRYDFTLGHLHPKDVVLEVGTGSGVFSRILADRCMRYTGLEFDSSACEATRSRLNGRGTLVQGDAQALPFDDGSFSAVVCLEVLEHLPDYRKAVKEIHRCLRPDGQAIISVPHRKRGGTSRINPYHLYEPGEGELVETFRRFFGKVEVWYQCFEETALMTFARKCRLRKFFGLTPVYRDLTLGKPEVLAKIQIGTISKGMTYTLLLRVSGRKDAPMPK